MGDAVWLMLNAHELTGNDVWLAEAHRLARRGIALFLDDNPLPRASHVHDHYEAVTNGDTLMMALLRLWTVEQQTAREVRLVYTDR